MQSHNTLVQVLICEVLIVSICIFVYTRPPSLIAFQNEILGMQREMEGLRAEIRVVTSMERTLEERISQFRNEFEEVKEGCKPLMDLKDEIESFETSIEMTIDNEVNHLWYYMHVYAKLGHDMSMALAPYQDLFTPSNEYQYTRMPTHTRFCKNRGFPHLCDIQGVLYYDAIYD